MTGIHDMKTRSCPKTKLQVSEIESDKGRRSPFTFLELEALKCSVFSLIFLNLI